MMLALLWQRNFALVWSGWLISMMGDWMLILGLPLHVYQLTGSTLATGAMFMASMTPRFALGSIAGVFVDRWDRRRVLIVTNLLLALTVLLLLAARSVEWLWLVYVVVLLEASLVQFVRPAQVALLPRLVNEDQLVTANSLSSLNQNVSRLIGPPLGGLVMSLFGLAGVVVVDAVSFLTAAMLTTLITIDARPLRAPAITSSTVLRPWMAFWREWLAGLELIRWVPTLTVMFIFIAVTGVGEGIMSTLLVPFVVRVLKGDEQGLGWLLAAQAAGGLVGGILLARFGRAFAPAHLLGLGAIGLGVIDLMIFNYHVIMPGLTLALILMTIVGLPSAAIGIGQATLLQLAVSDTYRGRILGAFLATLALASLIGAALGGLLGDSIGIVTVLNVQGAGYCLGGMMVMAMLRTRRIKSAMAQEGEVIT